MENSTIKRLYYSISEVSKLVDEEQYVLRYWETEFEQLRPQKNRAGNRVYYDHDIEVIRAIQTLLRIKRLTIEGAKEHLRTMQFSEPKIVHEAASEHASAEISLQKNIPAEPFSAEILSEEVLPAPQTNGLDDEARFEEPFQPLAPPNDTHAFSAPHLKFSETSDNTLQTPVAQPSPMEALQPLPAHGSLSQEAFPKGEHEQDANGVGTGFTGDSFHSYSSAAALTEQPYNTAVSLGLSIAPPELASALGVANGAASGEERFGAEIIDNTIPPQEDTLQQPTPQAAPILSRAELLSMRDVLRQMLDILDKPHAAQTSQETSSETTI
ncbi:MAG: MerR family transcriptional regulator [Candidatus Kapabacteria bacterium]|nr:MerR family transcriptional regulator [Candidatus Kapabacteria bacterium]